MTQDALFGHIEELQGSRWGRLLDAGTGHSSLRWIVDLPTTAWTAVTGEKSRAQSMQLELGRRMRSGDRIVVGNWSDPGFLEGERFEVVLADYLLGAVERHAPYFQEALLTRLRPLVAERLYLVGLEPYPQPRTPAEQVVTEIANLRDACHLLAGERYHREYPLEWVLKRLPEAGYRVLSWKTFPIVYRERFVEAELGVCESTLARVSDTGLASSLKKHARALRKKALTLCRQGQGLPCGFDYVIAAVPESS